MDVLEELQHLERQQFFNGQRLQADDLQYLEAFHREMRWLHNRSLHQPGIGNGYAIRGGVGDREVTVGPGYAIDALGREIVLFRDEVLQVPPVSAGREGGAVYFDLTVAYPDDAKLEEVETRTGICANRGTVRRREVPTFFWVRLLERGDGTLIPDEDSGQLARELREGLRVVIGRVEVLNCQLNSIVSLEQRRSARPAHQPVIGCGRHRPEEWAVVWHDEVHAVRDSVKNLLKERFAPGGNQAIPAAELIRMLLVPLMDVYSGAGDQMPKILPFSLQVTVPTIQAGFSTIPCYSAQVEGTRTHTLILPADEPPLIG